jgi:hypothetical protein
MLKNVKRILVASSIVVTLATVNVYPVSAVPPNPPPTPGGISMWWLQSLGYTCEVSGVEGWRCTKDGGPTYECERKSQMCTAVLVPIRPSQPSATTDQRQTRD